MGQKQHLTNNQPNVYIVLGEFVKNETTDKEVCAVFSTLDRAENFGEWLLNQEELNGFKYINFEVKNFFVL